MELASDIENLSPNKRALLARRITEELAGGRAQGITPTGSTNQQDKSESQRLVAYIVSDSDLALTSGDLRRFLSDKLPDYMVPSTFVPLKALPLTPNGKVDRQALPEPNPSRGEMAESFVEPRNEVEERLTRIWAEALGLEVVGIHDNFFELGGHSLLAVQLISRVRAAFQVDIPMRTLFEAPTVAGLADRIETIHWATQGSQPSHKTATDEREEIVL